MRILFFVDLPARLRHFSTVVCRLAEAGHTIVIATDRKAKPVRVCSCHPPLAVVPGPVERADGWARYAPALRLARDSVRYANPVFAGSRRAADRSLHWLREESPGLAELCETPFVRRNWVEAERGLDLIEARVPGDRRFRRFVRQQRPDAVLVTPYVFPQTVYQVDAVKAAQALGIPVAFLPFSWDNLTSKGAVRVVPDRVLVWNEIQRREAVDWHHVPQERVVVTGAPRFDPFFALEPSVGRDELLERRGLDPARPLFLFLGSSAFVMGDEARVVQEWVAALRADSRTPLRDANVLVRVHPKNTNHWRGLDVSASRPIAIDEVPSFRDAEQGLFDSLFHADAVVGVNTSALLEAAIVGNPVHALPDDLGPRAADAMFHFRYLAGEDGVLVEAATTGEHLDQLARSVTEPGWQRERLDAFVRRFLRPPGTGRDATTVMADEIERLPELAAPAARRPAAALPSHLVLRAALHGTAIWARRRGGPYADLFPRARGSGLRSFPGPGGHPVRRRPGERRDRSSRQPVVAEPE